MPQRLSVSDVVQRIESADTTQQDSQPTVCWLDHFDIGGVNWGTRTQVFPGSGFAFDHSASLNGLRSINKQRFIDYHQEKLNNPGRMPLNMAQARFTLRQLSAFVTVSITRNFGKAGDRLSLTASAVSQLVGELESAIGFRLFDRTTRSVSLSPAGREFLPSAKSVLKHMELAQAAAEDIRNRAAGIVRIAAPMILASTVLPAAIKAYTAKRPKVVVRIRDAVVDNLVDMVNNADVDLAVGPDQAVGNDVIRRDLFKSPWVLWCSASHPLAKRQAVSWAQLRRHPLVMAGRDYERTVSFTHSSATEDDRITPVDIVDNLSTAFGMAAAGLALTLAPAYVGLMARPLGLIMRPITQPEVIRRVCLYHSATRAVSPAAEGFLEHLIEWLGDRDDLGTNDAIDVASKPSRRRVTSR